MGRGRPQSLSRSGHKQKDRGQAVWLMEVGVDDEFKDQVSLDLPTIQFIVGAREELRLEILVRASLAAHMAKGSNKHPLHMLLRQTFVNKHRHDAAYDVLPSCESPRGLLARHQSRRH
jgi:hypothetical protein